MNSKKTPFVVAIIAIFVFGGGFLWWVNSGQVPEQKEVVPPVVREEPIESIKPDELGLTLKARADKRVITLEITELSDIQSIEYELSYLAKGDIPRGVIGGIEIKKTDKKITRELLLGTCSRNVCKYDEAVTSATIVVKITREDGKILQTEKTIDF